MPKFFYTHNVKKAPQGFEFAKAEFFAATASYCGIYATEKQEEIEKLLKAPGVKEISEDEFSQLAAKAQTPVNLTVVKQKTFMSPGDGKLTGRPAEVRSPEPAKPVAVFDDVIQPKPLKK